MSTLGDEIFDTMVAITREHADKLIAQGKIERLEKVNAAMLAALNEVEEFLDGQADVVDGDYGEPRPNRAMQLLTEVRAAIAKAERER